MLETLVFLKITIKGLQSEHNVTNRFSIDKVEDIGNNNTRITTPELHLLNSGDSVTLINQTTSTEVTGTVVGVPGEKIAIIRGLTGISVTETYKDLQRTFKSRHQVFCKTTRVQIFN